MNYRNARIFCSALRNSLHEIGISLTGHLFKGKLRPAEDDDFGWRNAQAQANALVADYVIGGGERTFSIPEAHALLARVVDNDEACVSDALGLRELELADELALRELGHALQIEPSFFTNGWCEARLGVVPLVDADRTPQALDRMRVSLLLPKSMPWVTLRSLSLVASSVDDRSTEVLLRFHAEMPVKESSCLLVTLEPFLVGKAFALLTVNAGGANEKRDELPLLSLRAVSSPKGSLPIAEGVLL